MKKKKFGRWIALVLLLLLCLYLTTGKEGFWALYLQQRETNRVVTDITALHHQIDSLRLEIKRLKSDTGYIERIAREKLGMARKDEKVFKFVEPKE